MRRIATWVLGLSIGVVSTLQAQAAVSFDVASIRLNKSGASATTLGFQQSGRFRAVNEPLWRLIAEAYRTTYQLRRFEILRIPEALTGDRFDVDAVAGANPTPVQRQVMLQTLLAERFKLVVHHEQRELPIYKLVKVQPGAKLGNQIHPSAIDCAALRATGGTPPPPLPNQARPCVMMFGQSLLSATGMTLTDLAAMGLSRYVNRVVLDQTGLQGAYAWTLEWTADGPAGAPADLNGISIFTALQDQLGLKLESARGSVRVLVIDSVERPTPD